MTCAGCGWENPEGFSFCGGCGLPLTGKPVSEDEAGRAERRQLTVLFCDLVGSTALSERLDPEDLSSLLRAYHSMVDETVGRHGGHVAQHLGDGALVYFGYPTAHEDAPRRAVRAALEIVERIASLEAEVLRELEEQPRVRIGIHAGLVVTGDVGAGDTVETLAVGKVPNVAARIQGLASPSEVVVSDSVRALVDGFFLLEDAGRHAAKGVSAPLQIWRVQGPAGHVNAFEVAQARGLTAFVGRDRELGILADELETVAGGRGRIVHLQGEAGIGKSHLQAAFRQQARERGATWLTCRCSPLYIHSAFHPLIELLQRLCGFEEPDDAAERRRKLRQAVTSWGRAAERALPVLADLLSLPLEPGLVDVAEPMQRKQETIQQLLALVEDAGRDGPLVFNVDDLHWVDASTLEFLELLGRRVADLGVLLLVSSRPDFRSPWSGGDLARELRLRGLDTEEARALALASAGGVDLDPAVLEAIVDRTDGVPLFVEELTRTLLGSGALQVTDGRAGSETMLAETAMPLTLQDSLAARLDALGDAKDVAQLAAVLGRRFSHRLLSAVAPQPPETLESHLRRALESGLLERRGRGADAHYEFRHALIRDAAYESLLKRSRRRLHGEVGAVLEARFPQVAETEPELLAGHFVQAGLAAPAERYASLAAARATSRWAHAEAKQHLRTALEQLALQPDSRERDQRELGLRQSLGVAQIATEGYPAQSVEDTFARALRLCDRIGETPFRIRYGIWAVRFLRANRAGILELMRFIEGLIETTEDPRERVMGYQCLSGASSYLAEHQAAIELARRGQQLFAAEDHEACVLEYGGCGAFYLFMTDPMTHQITGRVETARAGALRALAMAQELGHPFTEAMAELYVMLHGHESRAPELVERHARRALELCTDQEFVMLRGFAMVGLGWSRVQGGETAALEDIRAGLDLYRSTGGLILIPYYSAYLAEALLKVGRGAEALPLLEEGVRLSQSNLDAFYEAELHRLRGDVLRECGEPEGARRSYLAAHRVARAQGARLYALRASASLVRLDGLADGGLARERLSADLEDMPEGDATVDLVEARELLG